MFSLRHFAIRLVHICLRIVCGVVLLVAVLLLLLANGFPGRWLQPILDRALPETLHASVQHVSFVPGTGLILREASLRDASGKTLVSFSQGSFALRIPPLSFSWENLSAITLEDLFVAQIEYDPDRVTESEPPPEDQRRPFPELTAFPVPTFRDVALTFVRPNVLEVEAQRITGILRTDAGILHFSKLKGLIGEEKQRVEAEVALNIRQGFATASLRGFIYHTRLNGIWRAIDFPIIETYSNNFSLNSPAWGDCTFTVGFDKYKNIFDLRIDLAAPGGGSYCGVPFDSAEGTIRCHGIWDAVTTIEPIIAKRGGKVAATGSLVFDCPRDRFFFKAEGSELQPAECLKLIDMPFTEVIPAMSGTTPPQVTFQGDIPLLSEQTPSRINLKGHVCFPQGGAIEGFAFQTAESSLSMTNGTFRLEGLRATFSNGGETLGDVALAIPEDASTVDLSTHLSYTNAPLVDILAPLKFTTIPSCTASGTLDMACRPDATFPSSITSKFDCTIQSDRLARIPLFSSLTDALANHIPGFSALTDLTTVKISGSSERGVFTIPEFSLTGKLLAIEGTLAYDLPNDAFSAELIAGNFKPGSFMGVTTRWISFPVNSLLWEILGSGSLSNPKWKARSFVGKLWDKATHREDPTAAPAPTPPPDTATP